MEQQGLREFTLGNGLLVRLVAEFTPSEASVAWLDETGAPDRHSVQLPEFPSELVGKTEPAVRIVRQAHRVVLALHAQVATLRKTLVDALNQLELPDGDSMYLPLFGARSSNLPNCVDEIVRALALWKVGNVRLVSLGAEDQAAMVEAWWKAGELRVGSQGPPVARLQSLLGVPEDGVFRRITENSVRAFQRTSGLHVDGIVGPATWAELEVRGARVFEHLTTSIDQVSRVATSIADEARRSEGADAALMLAALCVSDPGVSTFVGRKDALAVGLKTYGIDHDISKIAPTDGHRLDAEGATARRSAESLVEHGLSPTQALVVALLTPPRRGGPHSVEPFLRACGTSTRQARAVVCRETDASTAAGRRILELLGESKARVSVSGTYANDRPDGPDLLDIADEVNALADVIAASERHPPLAVGLFGDWGSGKSFFIGRLKQRLDVLTHTARSARAENRPTTYAGRVVHVDFNAWQYADGNLWANLVHRIFDKLARELTGNAKDQESEQLEEQRKQLYGRLALSREQLVENEREKTAAAQASEAARVAQAVLAEQRNRAASKLVPPTLEDVARQILALPRTRELVAKVDAKLDQKAGLDVVQEVNRTRSELSTLQGRVAESLRWFRARHPYHLVLVTVSALAPLIIGLVSQSLDAWLEAIGSSKGVAVIATVLATGFTRLGSLQNQAKKVLTSAEEAQASIDSEMKRRQDQIVEQQTAAHQELAEANVQLLRAEEKRQATNQRIVEIQTEISNISNGGRLREFIRSRSAGANYRQHLGIVSTIREDFEHLHQHLADAQKELDPTAPPIERVVLYVDDLDRCPSDRVVEVLQAVHLLLDFPLFVAVVAVDSRWLLKSLAAHYEEQLGDAPDELSLWASTPQNFLETIFQIPLALRPMSATGYGDLIQSLLPVHAPEHRSPPREHPSNGASRPTPTPPAHATHQPPPAPSASSSTSTSAPASTSPAPTTATSSASTHSPSPPLPTALPSIDPNPAALLVTPAERDFLKRLAALVSTPRSAKRLVNLYWLTRASLREHDLDDFVGTEDAPGTYRVHQFLLAIMVSYPSMVDAFLATFDDPAVGRLGDALAKLGARAAGKDGSEALARDVSDGEALAWRAFSKKVEAVAQELELPVTADAFRDPVRRVARFSFRASAAFSARGEDANGPASIGLRSEVGAASRPSGAVARAR